MQLPRFTKLFTLIIFILLSKLIFGQAAKTSGRVTDDSVTLAGTTAATTGKFTIVLLPDTQFYTAEPQGTNGGTNTIFKRQIKWVINNRLQKNIVYVGQLGDCTEHGDEYEAEWKRSDTAMKLLEDSNLRFDPRYSLWYLHWQS